MELYLATFLPTVSIHTDKKMGKCEEESVTDQARKDEPAVSYVTQRPLSAYASSAPPR